MEQEKQVNQPAPAPELEKSAFGKRCDAWRKQMKARAKHRARRGGLEPSERREKR